jgi:hypothetical protein
MNASPSTPDNMAYSALLNGTAIGVVANTLPANGDEVNGTFSPNDEEPYINTFGYYLTIGVAEGKEMARVLAEKKSELGSNFYPKDFNYVYMTKLMMTYFGDPTVTINSSINDITENENFDESENHDSDMDVINDNILGDSGCTLMVF